MCGRNEIYALARRDVVDTRTITKQQISPEQKKEDYYRLARTSLVLTWVLTNVGLVILVTLLQPSRDLLASPDTVNKDTTSSGFYGVNVYFAIILWSVAALSLFRFTGSMLYLVESWFKRGR
jgi:chitin synthase